MRLNSFIILMGSVFISIAGYIIYIFASTGYWREIKALPSEKVYGEIHLPGVEDIAVDYSDAFMILSSDDRKGHRKGKTDNGNLYCVNLNDPTFFPYVLTSHLNFSFHPHGLSIFQIDTFRWIIWAINHDEGRHTIEKFEFNKSELVHLESINNPLLISPNDIVALDSNRFYVTNDHRYTSGLLRKMEDYLGLSWSNVLFFNGQDFVEVLTDISYANGLAIDLKSQKLFVASPRQFSIIYASFDKATGNLTNRKNIYVGSGADNLDWGLQGQLLTGAHPNLLAFTAYAAGRREYAPSEILQIDFLQQSSVPQIKSIFEDDGFLISGASVAIDLDSLLAIGTVMDSKVLLVRK